MELIRARIIQFLVGRAGSTLVPLIAAGVAWFVAKLTLLSPYLASMVNQEALTTFIWGIIMAGLNWVTNHWLTRDAKAIQAGLNTLSQKVKIDEDGFIGPQTLAAFTKATGIEVRRAEKVEPAAPPTGGAASGFVDINLLVGWVCVCGMLLLLYGFCVGFIRALTGY